MTDAKIINLRKLEGFHFFTAGPAMKPGKFGWVIAEPFRWAHGSIRFEDGSALDYSPAGEVAVRPYTLHMVRPTKPVVAPEIPGMAQRAFEKYDLDTIKRTFEALLAAWGKLPELPDFQNLASSNDALFDLIYGAVGAEKEGL